MSSTRDQFVGNFMRVMRYYDWSPYWMPHHWNSPVPTRWGLLMQHLKFDVRTVDLDLQPADPQQQWLAQFVTQHATSTANKASVMMLKTDTLRRMSRENLKRYLPLGDAQMDRLLRIVRESHSMVYFHSVEVDGSHTRLRLKVLNIIDEEEHHSRLGLPDLAMLEHRGDFTVPMRSHVVDFWTDLEAKMLEVLNQKGGTDTRVAVFAAKLMPHQIRNMIRITSKEWLGLAPVQMMRHYRFEIGDGALSPVCGLLRPLDTVTLAGPGEKGVMDRTVTIIQDKVGRGKTRSALSVVFLNGPRMEDPFDCAPAFGEKVPEYAKGLYPWTIPLRQANRLKAHGTGTYRFLMTQVATMRKENPLPRGATLIVIQHNMINHWLKEIEVFQEIRQLRVGVIGSDELARSKRVSPQEVADTYDIVLLPNTLLRASDMGVANIPFVELQTFDTLWQHSDGCIDDDGKLYLFRGYTEAEEQVTVIASSAYMHTHFDVTTRVLKVKEPVIAPHLTIVQGWSLETIQSMFNPRQQGVFARCLVRGEDIHLAEVISVGTSDNAHMWTGQHFALAHFAFAHDSATKGSPMSTIAKIYWARVIVDELHLYRTITTQKRKCIEALHCDSFVGLTAQSDMAFSRNMNLFKTAFESQDHPHSPTGSLHSFDRDLLSDGMFTLNSIVNSVDVSCRPAIKNVVNVNASSRLVQDFCASVRAAFAQRGYTDLRFHHLGIVAYQIGLVIKHILRQMSFGEEPFTLETYMAGINATIGERAGPRELGEATAAAAIVPDTIRQFIHNSNEFIDCSEIRHDITCPICFDDMGTGVGNKDWVAFKPCLHTMCTPCFTEAFGSRNLRILQRCVMCRTRVSNLAWVGGNADSDSTAAPAPPEETQQTHAAPAGLPNPSKIDHLLSLLMYLSLSREDEDGQVESASGVVIFCECSDVQMVSLQRRIQDALSMVTEVDVLAVLSSQTASQRNRVFERIEQNAKFTILLVRYRMCAVGLNFIFANRCIIFNLPHRADYLHQSIGRMCRIGQKSRVVEVWPILFENSFEATVWNQWKDTIIDGRSRMNIAELVSTLITN
jgi:hypothetical protein